MTVETVAFTIPWPNCPECYKELIPLPEQQGVQCTSGHIFEYHPDAYPQWRVVRDE